MGEIETYNKLVEDFKSANEERGYFIESDTYKKILIIIGKIIVLVKDLGESDNIELEKIEKEYESISKQYNDLFIRNHVNRNGLIISVEKYIELKNSIENLISNISEIIENNIYIINRKSDPYTDNAFSQFLEQERKSEKEKQERKRRLPLRIATIVTSAIFAISTCFKVLNVNTYPDNKPIEQEIDLDEFEIEEIKNNKESDFRKRINVDNIEYIDGVTIVHTGEYFYIFDEGGHYTQEILKMYDVYGNRFYSNCSSKKEAEELVQKLREEGENAIMGPKAPWRGRDGQIIKNRDEDAVGVYIVESRDEKIGEINVEKEIEDIEREDIEWCKQFIEGKIQWSRGNNSGENVETEEIR